MQCSSYRAQTTCRGPYPSSFTDSYLGAGPQPPATSPVFDTQLVLKLGNTTTFGGGVDDHFQLTGSLSTSGTTNVTPGYFNSTLVPGTYTNGAGQAPRFYRINVK